MDATLLNVKEEYMLSAQEILNINRYGYLFSFSTLYAYQLPIASRMNFAYRWTWHKKERLHPINTYAVPGDFDDPFMHVHQNQSLLRTHIWNSYFTPFSSCSPSATSNPTQSCNAACVDLVHSSDFSLQIS